MTGWRLVRAEFTAFSKLMMVRTGKPYRYVLRVL